VPSSLSSRSRSCWSSAFRSTSTTIRFFPNLDEEIGRFVIWGIGHRVDSQPERIPKGLPDRFGVRIEAFLSHATPPWRSQLVSPATR
jgi:hypothetical protein